VRRIAIAICSVAALAAAAPPESGAADRIARARAALSEQRFDEAARLAQEAAQLDPRSAEARRVAGLARFRGGRFAEARVEFLAELERERDDAGRRLASFNLAGAEFKLDHFAEAERQYLEAAKLPELAVLATLDAGLSAARAGHVDAAKQELATARALDGSGTLGAQAERLAGELEDSDRSRRRDRAYATSRQAAAALKQGREGEAVRLLEQALADADAGAMKPGDRAEIDFALATALIGARRPLDAVQAARRALKVKPTDAEFHFTLGVALLDAHKPREAQPEFRAALAAHTLGGSDAASAREHLQAIADHVDERLSARVTLDDFVAAGYDSNYATGREVLQMKGVRTSTTDGSAEIATDLDLRVRLVGRPSNGLYLSERVSALIYLESAADSFSLLEDDLSLDGGWSPTSWLTLKAHAEGYLQTAGILHFGLYQAGFLGSLTTTFWEGQRFATRLRYGHTYMSSLDPAYDYLTGNHDEAGGQELLYAGSWRIGVGYVYRREAVGAQTFAAASALPTAADGSLRCFVYLGRTCATPPIINPATGKPYQYPNGAYVPEFVVEHLEDPSYTVPWSYDSHDAGIDADGDLGWGLRLSVGTHYEHRAYLPTVQITPDLPAALASLYHHQRVDDRVTLDASLKRELFAGIWLRVSAYFQYNYSTINLETKRFDYDDFNYTRFVITGDLLRPF
jgi:tetratricopeptide (TPR) repeat protein